MEAISCFHVYAGEEFESKCSMTKAPFVSHNIWPNSWNFEMLWNFLEYGNTLKPLEMVQILFENLVRKCWGEHILLVCIH